MSTSARMLRLLSLLQTHRYWPGPELCQRLEVSPRTLRRDIERLRDLGYDVDAARGLAGGYQLRAGGQLPPLLLDDDEAVAIAVGLHSAAASSVSGVEETSVRALTKVLTLLPPRLRRQIDAVASHTDSSPTYGPVVNPTVLTTLAQGCRDDEVLAFGYTARGGDRTERSVEPHRLVSQGRRWYLVAYDRGRHDWRSFRVDRIADASLTGSRFRPRELPSDDARAFVQAGISAMPHRYFVSVLFHTSYDEVARPWKTWGEVTETADGCRATAKADALEWPMMLLAAATCEFTIEGPPELRQLITEASQRLARAGSGDSQM